MALTLTQIRELIAARLTTALAAEGLHVYPHAPDNIVTPCAYPIPTGTEYTAMGRGGDEHSFDLMVLAATQNDAAGQECLDQFIGAGAKSIRNAIWADPSLGNADVHCQVARMRDYGFTEQGQGGVRFYQAVLELKILTSGV
jgi:hypothetical protein